MPEVRFWRTVGETSPLHSCTLVLDLGARPMGTGIGGTHAREHRKQHDPDADRPTKD